MEDKRLTHRLTEYWNQLRGDHPLPQWEKFDTLSFNDIWQQCCGWSVNADDAACIVYTYEYIGESIKRMAGKNLAGKKFVSPQSAPDAPPLTSSMEAGLISDLFTIHFNNFPAARVLQKIDRVVKRPALIIEEGRANTSKGEEIRFRSCLLPFGTEAGKVTHMVLGLSWKAS